MTPDGLVAKSRAMQAVLDEARRFASADANVLIVGETGVGKDTMARALHTWSGRRAEPFVTVDCPGLAPTLIESELFGYERGAFTDAVEARAGRLESAGGGTVYLDGIQDLSLDAQATLLRAVETKLVERLGGNTPIALRARIVASADDRIEAAVSDGSFRRDLFHRLGVLPLRIPPLRERPVDILPLAQSFLADVSVRLRIDRLTLSAEARATLLAYPWPGNVRQLHNIIERAVLSRAGGGSILEQDDLPVDLLRDQAVLFGPHGDRAPPLAEIERRYIALTLREARGSQTKAAAILGISRKALWEKRRRYGLD